LFTQE